MELSQGGKNRLDALPNCNDDLVQQELFEIESQNGCTTKDWKIFIEKCSGAFPDFPIVEEIREDMGEDAVREKF